LQKFYKKTGSFALSKVVDYTKLDVEPSTLQYNKNGINKQVLL